MKLCIHCESDLVVKKNFLAWKIPIAIILAFIPYGIFICWLPFLLPSKYACNNCGRELSQVKEVDWREFEKLKKEKQEEEAT